MGTKVLLWYDVEDYITEESDDALLALLDMMEARGIKGTFKLVGEKIRVLQGRGRADILARLARMDVGYHTDMHSEHPTISEYCEPLGFEAGALEFERREEGGLADLKHILKLPISTYGQPGAAWAPQVFPVLRKWNIPTYVDYNDMIDLDYGPFWYGGVLSLTLIKGIMRMELEAGGLDKAKTQFDALVGSGEELISIFYHPCEFSTVEFWDAVNFSRGVNTPRQSWKRSRLCEPGQLQHYVEMLGQFVDYMLAQGCEFITTAQLTDASCFGDPDKSPVFTAGDIEELAVKIGRSIDYMVCREHSLCASEVFSLLRSSLCGNTLQPQLIYGPEQNIATELGAQGSVEDYIQAVRAEFPTVMGFPRLPDFFLVNGKRVNPVDMACTLAHILCTKPAHDRSIEVITGTLAPQRHINANQEWGEKWIIFPEDFKVSRLLETARLQAWTLKPALWLADRKG